jgi:penicillin amidase
VIRRRIWLVAGVLLLVVGVLGWLALRSVPMDPPRATVAGIGAPVEIRYDAARRGFVSAATLGDALFAQGWLHGRERLWQMELLRRAGRGRLAEALGEGLVATDRELWTAGVPQLGARLAANASSFLQAQVASYVAGVNAALTEQRHAPPEFLLAGFEPEPWTAADVFAVAAVVAFQSGRNYHNELLRLALATELTAEQFAWFLPDERGFPEFPYVVPEGVTRTGAHAALAAADALSPLDAAGLASAALGSNGWVVSPARSATGHALFAFDSHDAFAMPSLFYEVHLFFGSDGRIRGWSVPGLPGVINGYNRHLAWGLTNIGDTQDLFVEQSHPDNGDDQAAALRFLGPNGWYEARVERVEIPVKGRPPELLEIVHSRHGPLIRRDPPLALRWSGHAIGELGMDAFLRLNLADDRASFEAALNDLPVPSANVTYADTAGTIGFRTVGLLPRRRAGRGLVPHPGAGDGHGWDGFLPVAELPRRLNPPEGYLAAANARVSADPAPLVSADNAPGYRMRRLRQVLSRPGRLTLADLQKLQVDWYNAQAELLLPVLLPAVVEAAATERERRAAAVLAAWQQRPVNAPDLAAPVIWEHLYLALAEAVFAPALSSALYQRLLANNYVLNHALDRVLLDGGDSPWWRGDRAAVIGQAFRAAVAAAAGRLAGAPDTWRWDAVQALEMPHELAGVPLVGRLVSRGPYPWGGGPATVGRARYRYHQPFRARAGATVRVVAELAPEIRARAIMPGGQSGHPAGAHYADQLPRWLAGELDPIAGTPAELGAPVTRLVPRRR